MMQKENIELKKIDDVMYEIPKTGKMLVPTRVFASQDLLKDIKKDLALEQARNIAMLPGVVKYAVVLPDAHQGYGFPIGGVAAFDLNKGNVSPGGVGYDINCGVRLIRTNILVKDFKRLALETN